MKNLFVDCSTGLAGDMLLAAFLDLGIPREVIEKPLALLGLENAYELKTELNSSYGLRGLRVSVENLETQSPRRLWKDIREMIKAATLPASLQEKVLLVFKTLAIAEASVHGQPLEDVHFHEIGAIDALVDVVGVCAAVDHLSPKQFLCAVPPAGYGTVDTAHGKLPVPAPAVLELARTNLVRLDFGEGFPPGELTTPTGLALMIVLADRFGLPSSLGVSDVGVGLGHRNLGRPNLLRICELDYLDNQDSITFQNELSWQEVVVQESWIDDATPEELAYLSEQLRNAGAIDVSIQPIQMKKGRQGASLTALVAPKDAPLLRLVWFSKGSTIGVRERTEGRWVLPRRSGFCKTSLGKVRVKEVRRPNGQRTLKPEYEDLLALSSKTGHSFEEIRREVLRCQVDFVATCDWSC